MIIKSFGLTILLASFSLVNIGLAQTAKDDVKGAGQDIKQAAKSTGSAAKKTGKATKKTVKKGVNKTAEKTEEGATRLNRRLNRGVLARKTSREGGGTACPQPTVSGVR